MNGNNAITVSMPPIPSMSEVESLKEICKVAAYSGFLSSSAPRNDMTWRVADAFFVVMYGRELGIPAMTALKTIYVIDGKPSCSGQALLALMRRGGVQVEIPDPAYISEAATIRVKRPGGEWREFTYTQKMAEDAGLWEKGATWKKYWREMMIWRAVTTASKMECSDITGGLYTIEEMSPNTPLDADGAPIGDIITPAGRITVERPVEQEPEQLQDGVEAPPAPPRAEQPPPPPPQAVAPLVGGQTSPLASASSSSASTPAGAPSGDAFDKTFPPQVEGAVITPLNTAGDDKHLPRDVNGLPILGTLDMQAIGKLAQNEKLISGQYHFANLIDLLWRDGEIRAASKPEAVLDAIRKHEAAKDMAKEGVGAR